MIADTIFLLTITIAFISGVLAIVKAFNELHGEDD